MSTATTARVRNVPTWQMTTQELARTWAAQNGVTARTGGWLYDSRGRAVCQGWDVLAAYLHRRGVIVANTKGAGVNWRRADQLGTPALVAGARQAATEGRAAARARR